MRWTTPALAFTLVIATAPTHAEVNAMTRERLPEAEQLGRKAVKDSAIVHVDTCRTKAKFGIHIFDVRLMTPFSSVASAVFESKGKKTPLDLSQWPLEPVDQQSVIVSVDPAAVSGAAPAIPLSVSRVVLRRGEQAIEARRADTHEVLFPALDEKHRKYRGGTYYFSLEPFASEKGDLEIVVIPETDEPGAEAVLKLKKADLAKLR